MSDEQTVEQKAEAMGWSPKEQFRGDPERWIDAATYVDRGENLLPIVKAQNRELRTEVSVLRGKQTQLEATVKESQEAIQALKEIHTEATMRAAKDRKKELVTAIEVARKEGEVDTVVALTEALDEHQTAIVKAQEKPVEKAKPTADMTKDPVWVAWKDENKWFDTDERRTRLAVAIAGELRAKGNTLAGKEFFDKVSEEVEKTVGGNGSRQSAAKVEGSKGGGGEGSTGKSYSDLPADVKEICDRQSKRVTGEGKAFKDIAAFRKHYVSVYFTE